MPEGYTGGQVMRNGVMVNILEHNSSINGNKNYLKRHANKIRNQEAKRLQRKADKYKQAAQALHNAFADIDNNATI
jgi:hypothetical protein